MPWDPGIFAQGEPDGLQPRTSWEGGEGCLRAPAKRAGRGARRSPAFFQAALLPVGALALRAHGACILMRPASLSLADPVRTDVGFEKPSMAPLVIIM